MGRAQKDEELTYQSKDPGSMKEQIDKLTDDVIAQTIQTPEPGPPVFRVTRVGWAVILEEPGEGPAEWATNLDKTGALKVATEAAQTHAKEIGGPVEVHEQDGQGRHISTRYFKPKKGK
jgi:hypothetical protein